MAKLLLDVLSLSNGRKRYNLTATLLHLQRASVRIKCKMRLDEKGVRMQRKEMKIKVLYIQK